MQLIRSDIVSILEQIQFEFAGLTPVSPTLLQGLCNPSGKGDNLVVRRDQFGAADNLLPRASGETESREAEAGTSFQQAGGRVIGSQPVANTASQSARERAFVRTDERVY